jgi:cathepsin A (carboxypeptidase C)
MKVTIAVLILVIFYVNCDDIFLGEEHETGFIEIEDGLEMFYWLFKARNSNPKAPLVLWLQGGPGGTAAEAVLNEIGPYRVNPDDLKLIKNEYAFNNFADALFLDNPLGTGFSNAPKDRIPKFSLDVAADLYTFFLGFLEKHSEYKGRPLYLSGHSYAGHYYSATIPYFLAKQNPDIKMKGLILGNPSIDKGVQLSACPNFAKEHDLVSTFHFISSHVGFFLCRLSISLHWEAMTQYVCSMSYKMVLGVTEHNFNALDISMSKDYNFNYISNFMNQAEVNTALNTTHKIFHQFNLDVKESMREDYYLSYSENLKSVLESEMSVIVHFGVNDFLNNWRGGIDLMNKMGWDIDVDDKENWRDMYLEGKVVAQVWNHYLFRFVKVFNAGHLVMYDTPQVGVKFLDSLVYAYQ